jgi:hypothetical protein
LIAIAINAIYELRNITRQKTHSNKLCDVTTPTRVVSDVVRVYLKVIENEEDNFSIMHTIQVIIVHWTTLDWSLHRLPHRIDVVRPVQLL